MRIRVLAVVAIALSSCLSPGPPPGAAPATASAKPTSRDDGASPVASSEGRALLLGRLKELRAAAGVDEPATMPNVDKIVDQAVVDIAKRKRKPDTIIDLALRDAAQSAGRDCKAWWLPVDSLSDFPMPRELVAWQRALVSFGVVKGVDASGKEKYFVLIFAPDPSVQRGGYEPRF
jgi:hypothetical protein